MKFINKGVDRKVREKRTDGYYSWQTVRTGDTIELPRDTGIAYGFFLLDEENPSEENKVTEGKVSDKKVETKQFEGTKKKESLAENLEKIKGIGKKTAEDILKVYPNEESLIDAISKDKGLPFRDDVSDILRKKYGTKKY